MVGEGLTGELVLGEGLTEVSVIGKGVSSSESEFEPLLLLPVLLLP